MKEFDTGLPRRKAEREAGAMAVQYARLLPVILSDSL